MPAVPFKLNQDRRHRIPRQKHKVTNWREYDASLCQRGSLTVWFTAEAIAAWRAAPHTTRGGQPWYSPLAILTGLTLRTVFRLALRQTEGLIGSLLHPCSGSISPCRTTPRSAAGPRPWRCRVLGPTTPAPGPCTTCCGGQHRPQAGRPRRMADREARHEIRRSWRKLLLGVDAGTGRIEAVELTGNETDDGARVGPWLDQVEAAPVASFTGGGA